jgi:DNA-binding transcriptional LysR family regulator
MDEDEKMVIKPCYQWNHSVVVPIGHPLLNQQLTLETIAKYPVLTYSKGFTGRSNIEKAFDAAGIHLDIALAAADSDVIKTYVRLGFGVGIIAGTSYEKNKDTDLVALSLTDFVPVSTTKFAYLRQNYLPAYTRFFVEQLQTPIKITHNFKVVDKAKPYPYALMSAIRSA